MTVAELTAYFPAETPWTTDGGRLRLQASSCPECGAVAFPPRVSCHACGKAEGTRTIELSPTGRLYTFTEIHSAPSTFKTPLAVGYVDFPEGARVFGQLDGLAAEHAVDETVHAVLGPVRTDPDGRTIVSYRFRRD